MSKFDRCIFILIAIGIWALTMTQVFKPEPLEAKYGFTNWKEPTTMLAECPKWFVTNTRYDPKGTGIADMDRKCDYLMVVTYDDLVKHRKHFKQ